MGIAIFLSPSAVLAGESTFFGPIFEYKKDESSKVYTFRPIIYYEADYELKFRSLDILYPFISYQEDSQQTQFKALFSMIRYSNFNDYDNMQEKRFSVFPILDIAWSGKKENDYFSLFPLWGTLKDKYNKEEINYFLFPLYLETKKKNSINRHFLWPFITKVEGKYISGFKLWPLFGYESKVDKDTLRVVKESKFFLWPLYSYKKDTGGGINLEEKIYFPFYLSSNSSLHKSKTYLWPFFNIYLDKTSNQTTYNMPWPIIQYKKGVNIKSQRFFPLYSYVKTRNVEKGFYLWPLYRYKNEILATDYFKTKSFLFFLYKEDTYYDLRTNTVKKEFSSLWPLYSKDTYEDGYDFRIFSPVESFFSKNEKIRKIWSPMWSIVRLQDDSKSSQFSLLFNLIKTENDKENRRKKFSVNFLLPIISLESEVEKTKFNILGGLLGFETGDNSKIRILYIPINI
jgi:hypothetical protein